MTLCITVAVGRSSHLLLLGIVCTQQLGQFLFGERVWRFLHTVLLEGHLSSTLPWAEG